MLLICPVLRPLWKQNNPVDHFLVKVSDMVIIAPYTVRLSFDDGARQTIDFVPVLHGHTYSPLRDRERFAQVRIDPEIGTLVWPNGADFDPATLYYWNDGEGEELAARLAQLTSDSAR
jgi:hypothetical protein